MSGYADTNLLVRILTGDPPEMAERAVRLLERHSPAKVASAVLLETAYVLQGVYGWSREAVAKGHGELLASTDLEVEERGVWHQTLMLFRGTALHLVDCYLAARALHEGVALHTFDHALAREIERRRGEGGRGGAPALPTRPPHDS